MVKKQNKNQNKAKRRKQGVLGMPSRFPRAFGDEFNMPFKFTELLTIPAGSSTAKRLYVLGKGTSTGDYVFFNNVCAAFLANSIYTTRWMITDLKVQVRATGVGGSSNTFIAASYIPSNTTLDNPPVSLAEVSQSMHYAESSLGTVGNFAVNPPEYFNDWRQVTDNDDSDSQCGLIQVYGSGTPGSEGVTAGAITVSGRLHMNGLRL